MAKSLIGERQVTRGNGGILQAEGTGYPLDGESFWFSEKFRIVAEICK